MNLLLGMCSLKLKFELPVVDKSKSHYLTCISPAQCCVLALCECSCVDCLLLSLCLLIRFGGSMFNDSLVVHDIFFGLSAMRNYN